MNARYSNATKAKIEQYRAAGYEIVEGNNPFFNKAKKRAGLECVRICQTNSKRHGKSMWTVWGVK